MLGLDPSTQRTALLENVSYIPDVAILPPWITVAQLLQLMPGLHPRFDAALALERVQRSGLKLDAKVKQLSRGMVVQLHLALISAIDAKLMILDEPTLGLDIPARKAFFDMLVNDWCQADRTVLIATHQVDEIEHLLTDVMMLSEGALVLNASLDQIENQFSGLRYTEAASPGVQAAKPLHQFRQMGGACAIFNGNAPAQIAELGQVFRPSLSDVFVALTSSSPVSLKEDHAAI